MTLNQNLKEVLEKIEAAKSKSPWSQRVELIAATKTRDNLMIEELYHLGVKTIGENRVQEAENKFLGFPGFENIKKRGGTVTDEMKKQYEQTAAYELSLKKPDAVSDAFMHALFDDKPLRRYVVTPNQEQQAFTIYTKVQQLVELNQWGPHSYSRDQLLGMLDKALAEKAK